MRLALFALRIFRLISFIKNSYIYILNLLVMLAALKNFHASGYFPRPFFPAVVILCFNLSFTLAQPFGPQNLLSSGQVSPPADLAVNDINNDGFPDVMVSGPPGIVWYRNTEAGGFAFQETLMPDFPGVEFEPGDFNGDGLIDMVFAHGSFNYLCWCENSGDGNFNPYIILNNVSYDPRYLLVCDLDLDGDEDIIVSFIPHDRSCWYENDGNAGFSLHELNAPYHEGVVSGIWDKEGDGDPDLIIRNESHIQWLENNGLGIFISLHAITSESASFLMDTGDFDSDNDEDLALYNENTDELRWFENQSNPMLIAFHSIGEFHSLRSVSCSDFDLDGDIDLLTGSYSGDGISLLENLGNGVFSSLVVIFNGGFITQIVSGDLNLDGMPDFVNLEQVSWYANNGNLSFTGPFILTSETAGPKGVLAADTDLDGYPDIITRANNGALYLFPNTWNQSFGDLELINDSVADNCGYPCGTEPVSGDFDNDGDPDLALGEFNNYVLLNDGTGVYNQVQKLDRGWEPQEICLEDLNMDGFEDILLSSYSDIQWYKNLGNGQFSPRISIYSYAWYGISVFAGDLDNNGTPDLIYSSPDYNHIAYRFNDGQGNFGEDHYIYPTSMNPSFVETADLDLDGNMDIMATLEDEYSAKLVWYKNLGNSNWSEEMVITEGDFSCGPEIIDLDADGDADILSTDILSTNSSAIIWCENLGGGVFNEPEIINEEIIWASGVFAADIDGDSDLDILSSSYGDGKIAWYENLRKELSTNYLSSNINSIQIYPCPAYGDIVISSSCSNIVRITVNDISGRLIIALENPYRDDQIRLYDPPNTSGVCILKVQFEDGSCQAKKVVFQ